MDTALKDDLAYVRDLAEAGQNAPLLGGRFMLWWGVLATVAYLGHYIGMQNLFGAPTALIPIVWITFLVLGIGGQAVLIMTFPRDKPGASSAGNRTEAIVWGAAGSGLFVFFGALIIKSVLQGAADAGFMTSLPVVFTAYGIGLITSGLMGSNRTLTFAGYAAFAVVAISVWFVQTPEVWLVAALGAFLTVLLPGIFMLRQEPKSVV